MSLCTDRFSSTQRILLRCLLMCAMSLRPESIAFADGERERSISRSDDARLPLPTRVNGENGLAASRTKSVSNGGGLWATVLALGAILGTLSLAGRWLKPYFGAPRGLPIEAFELLGRRMIEPKVSVHLVRCGGRVLVLGLSSEGVRTLSEIDDPHEVDRLTKICVNQSDALYTATARPSSLPTDGPSKSYLSRSIKDPRHAAFKPSEERSHG